MNSSFHKLPRGKTIESWKRQVEENFRFSFKLWKQITHNRNKNFEKIDVYNFLGNIEFAGNYKGCLPTQFPASLGKENFNQLNYLLDSIRCEKSSCEWKLSIEFRNRSWYEEDVCELLKSYNVGMVLNDISKSAPPFINLAEDFVYIRFHGLIGNYRGSYS